MLKILQAVFKAHATFRAATFESIFVIIIFIIILYRYIFCYLRVFSYLSFFQFVERYFNKLESMTDSLGGKIKRVVIFFLAK